MTSKQMSQEGLWHQDNLKWRGAAELQKITVIGYNNSPDVIGGELKISKSKDGSNSTLLSTNAPGTIISALLSLNVGIFLISETGNLTSFSNTFCKFSLLNL